MSSPWDPKILPSIPDSDIYEDDEEPEADYDKHALDEEEGFGFTKN